MHHIIDICRFRDVKSRQNLLSCGGTMVNEFIMVKWEKPTCFCFMGVIKMDKTKTSRKRKASSLNMSKENLKLGLKKNVRLKKFDPDNYLTADFIGSAIMECLLNNDPEGVVELLAIYLDEHNKVEFLKEAHVSRSTAYQVLRHKNPTIKTLAKIVSTTVAH